MWHNLGQMQRLMVCVFLLLVPFTLRADTINLDFESLGDLELVTTQFPGATFSNTIALEFSLNALDFPPASGFVVVSDDFGPISISFSSLISSFSGFFTYLFPLTLEAFDAAGNLVATAFSLFSDNTDSFFADFGSSPNELLSLNFAAGIARVTITGDPSGFSFTMDDVTYEIAEVVSVPEPGTISLFLLGGLLLLLVGRRNREVILAGTGRIA